jgi:protein phosphatase 1 regulatory subunit 11
LLTALLTLYINLISIDIAEMATAQQSRPASHGSRTLTINQVPTNEAGPSTQPSNPPVGVLKLRGGPSRKAKVEWSEEVVDNEGMGRKKSKSRLSFLLGFRE